VNAIAERLGRKKAGGGVELSAESAAPGILGRELLLTNARGLKKLTAGWVGR